MPAGRRGLTNNSQKTQLLRTVQKLSTARAARGSTSSKTIIGMWDCWKLFAANTRSRRVALKRLLKQQLDSLKQIKKLDQTSLCEAEGLQLGSGSNANLEVMRSSLRRREGPSSSEEERRPPQNLEDMLQEEITSDSVDPVQSLPIGSKEGVIEVVIGDIESEFGAGAGGQTNLPPAQKQEERGNCPPIGTAQALVSGFLNRNIADETTSLFADCDPEWLKEQTIQILAAFCAKCRLPIRCRRLLIKLFRVFCLLFNVASINTAQIPSADRLERHLGDITDDYKGRLICYCSGCLNPLKDLKASCAHSTCELYEITRKLIGKEQKIWISTVGIKPQIEDLVRRKYRSIKSNLNTISAAREAGVWTEVIHSKAYEEFIGENPTMIDSHEVVTISLIMNWDGLPVAPFTGGSQVWTVSATVTELQPGDRSLIENLLYFTTFVGPGEPRGNVMKLCIQRALKDLQYLWEPFEIDMGQISVHVRVKLFCVVADTPARANLFMFVHHASPLACFKCFDAGFRSGTRNIWLPYEDPEKKRQKTTAQFEMMADLAEEKGCFELETSVCGVTGRSPMLDVCSTDQLLTEVFHLIKEGLLKKIHLLQVGKVHKEKSKYHIPRTDWDKTNQKYLIRSIVSKTELPTGFKSIGDPFVPAKLNGDSIFGLYLTSWPVVLTQCSSGKADTYWFTYLVVLIIRIMVQPQMEQMDLDTLSKLIGYFRRSAPEILGLSLLGINIHNISQHLDEQIQRFLFLFDLDASVYESHNGLIKRTATFGNLDQTSMAFTRRSLELKAMFGLDFEDSVFADQEEIKSFVQTLNSGRHRPYVTEERSKTPTPGKEVAAHRISKTSLREQQAVKNLGLTWKSLTFFESFSFRGRTYAGKFDYSCGGNVTCRSVIVYRGIGLNPDKHFGVVVRIFRTEPSAELLCIVSRLEPKCPIWTQFQQPPECKEMRDFKEGLKDTKCFWFETEPVKDFTVIRADCVLGPAALSCALSRYFVSDLELRYVHN